MGWSIEPNNPEYVTDKGNGNYVFKPQADDITYTIKYVDDNDPKLSGETKYTVMATDCYINPCLSSLEPPSVCFTPSQESNCVVVKEVESDSGYVEVNFVENTCWKLIDSAWTGNITSLENNGKKINYAENRKTQKISSIATYKFENKAANITASSFVTIEQKVNPCINDNRSPIATPPTASVPAQGTDNERKVKVTTSCTNNNCNCWKLDRWEFIEPTPPNHASFVGSGDKKWEYILVDQNETVDDKTIKAKYYFVNVYNSAIYGDSIVTITQDGIDPCQLDTDCPSLSQTSFDADAVGETITVSYNPSVGDCWSLSTTKGGDTAQIGTITTGASSTSVVINPNTDGSSKSMTVNFAFTNSTNGESCDDTVTITQEAGYNCGSFRVEILDDSIRFPHEAQTRNNFLKIIADSEDFYNNASLEWGQTIQSLSSGATTVESGKYCKTVTMDLSKCNDNVISYLYLKIGDTPACEMAHIYRVCPCGTDNCLQELTNTETPVNYPLYVQSYSSYNYYVTSDSVIVGFTDGETPNWVLTDYDGVTISGNASWTDASVENIKENGEPLDSSGNAYVGYKKYFKSDASGNPTECSKTDNDWWMSVFMLSNNILLYITKNEPGHPQRFINLTYHVPSNTPIINRPGVSTSWVGFEACTTFTTTIYQASYGKCWEKIDETRRRECECD